MKHIRDQKKQKSNYYKSDIGKKDSNSDPGFLSAGQHQKTFGQLTNKDGSSSEVLMSPQEHIRVNSKTPYVFCHKSMYANGNDFRASYQQGSIIDGLTLQPENGISIINQESNIQRVIIIKKHYQYCTEMNAEYQQSGQQLYKVDGIFSPNEIVLPLNCSPLLMNAILSVNEKQPRQPSPDELSQNCMTSVGSTPFHQNSANQAFSSSVSHNDLFSFNPSRQRQVQDQKPLSSYSQVMMDRWQKSNINIPNVDKVDLSNESPHICQDVNVTLNVDNKRQGVPEFTQSSYLRMRSLEEAFATRNYLDPQYLNEQLSELQVNGIQSLPPPYLITQYDRSYSIQKIFDLHDKKDYKKETLFQACAIFDRYLMCTGWQTFPRQRVCRLATASLLLAAKLEQPVSPSFSRMVSLLSEEEQKTVNKQSLKDLEFEILMHTGFDYNYPGPVQSLERYLRILNYDKNQTILDMSFQICKFQLNDSKFLEYRPSQMAACAVILSINIYERDLRIKNNLQQKAGLIQLNTEVWNNIYVVQTTGYCMELLKEPLYQLAKFIQKNLTPDRLQGFDIEGINDLRNC